MKKLINFTSLLTLGAFGVLGSSSDLHANMKSVVGYEKFQRLNSPVKKVAEDNWLAIGLDGDYETTDREYSAVLDADARFFFTENQDMVYSVPRAYLGKRFDNSTLKLGREKLDWNPNEEFWALGNLNPRQNFELMGEKQEGLVGLHYKFSNKYWDIGGFFSYFYVPELNPPIDIHDGQVTSNMEWVHLPPSQTIIQDREVPIFYQLNDPQINDIIFQKSLGANLAYKWEGGKLSSYMIYKPESSLRINAEAYYEPQKDAVVVEANPIVNHHVMFGGHVEQKVYQTTLRAGADFVDPNASLGKDYESLDPVKLRKTNRIFDSAYLKIEPNYKQRAFAYLSSLYQGPTFGLNLHFIEHLGDEETGSDDFYSETVRWERAVGADFSYKFSYLSIFKLQARYDLVRRDNLVKAEYNQKFKNLMGLRLVGAYLGAELLKSPSVNSYWSPYRANDTVYGGVKYFF